jgi:ribosome-binding factor A
MQEYGRYERVGSEIKRELAAILRDDVRDDRLAQVTVQEVRVTRDLAHAKVFFTLLAVERAEEMTKALNRAAGYLRHRLSEAMRLRSMPLLHFVYDTSVGEGMHLTALIDAAVAKDKGEERDDG